MDNERLTQIRKLLRDWQVEGVLITSPANRRWLSGFTGSNGQLLITQEKALLATDFRYYEQAQAQAPEFTLFKHQRRAEDTVNFLKEAGVRLIGVEAQHLTLAEANKLKKAGEDIRWLELEQTVEALRQSKTAVELSTLRTAAAITDHAMAQVGELAQPGMTERQLAWELEKIIREAGADGMAFELIVASGPNSAFPHARPSDRQLQKGDAIVIDMGAQLNGYRSDLTRTFHLGNQPSEQFWQVYHLVQAAQTAVMQTIRPGMSCKAVDAIARDLIAAGGYGDHFGHGLGHGVGLDIHEGPSLSFRSLDEEQLVAGATVTIEPGIYIPGWGGVRIEDFVVLTADGSQALSHCPKNPVISIL